MKKEITTGQLLGAAVSILVPLIVFFWTMSNKVTKLEERTGTLEANQTRIEKFMERMSNSMEELSKGQTQILIKVENKKDR